MANIHVKFIHAGIPMHVGRTGRSIIIGFDFSYNKSRRSFQCWGMTPDDARHLAKQLNKCADALDAKLAEEDTPTPKEGKEG